MRVIPELKQPGDAAGGAPRGRRLRAIAVLPTLATRGNQRCGVAAGHFCMRARFAAGGV